MKRIQEKIVGNNWVRLEFINRDFKGNIHFNQNIFQFDRDIYDKDGNLITGGSGGGGVPEAPEDGTTYGREDASWVRAVNALGDKMVGSLEIDTTGETYVMRVSDASFTSEQYKDKFIIKDTVNEYSMVVDETANELRFKVNNTTSLGIIENKAPITQFQPDSANQLTRKDYVDSNLALKEDGLGNPTSDGDTLSSTTAGARSWVSPTFLGLTDTPTNYTGYAGESVVVNSAENALEYSTRIGQDTTGTTSSADTIWTGTQAEYDALGSYDSNTLYFIQ